MVECGWTRLAHLLFALTILIALAQLGSPSADPRPLDRAADENPPAAEAGPRSLAPTPRREDTVAAALADRDESNGTSAASAGAPDAPNPGPPVFYRPAPANPTSGRGGGAGPLCADLGTFPSNRALAFPLPKEYLGSYEDTWGAPRPQGGHEGTDLMAPTGTAEYAMTNGTIVPVAGANENGWNFLGGYAVMLEADYSIGPVKKGDLFYYAHLERESALEIGTRVRVGQTIGYAGDTGQGPEVTRGLFPPHLHFGWYGARSTATSGAMNPYPLLEWIRAEGGAITGGSDARYCEAPRTGGPIPSTGEDRWPAPDSPGVSPDLGTGRQIHHASGAVATHHKEPAPKTTPQAARPSAGRPPPSRAPNPPAPRAEPPPGNGAPGDESPDPPEPGHTPIPEADPGGDEANDPPGDADKGVREDPGEEPRKDEPGEDKKDENTSPGEDQYAPESGGESDPETAAR